MTPIILEKFPYPRLVRCLHRGTKPVVIVGITLSTLHHSSLGSLFLVTPSRLHEIWYTSWLPILFFVSAVGGGMMFVVLVAVTYSWLKDRRPDYVVLRGIATAAAVVLSALFILRLIDVGRRDAWASMLSGSPESLLFGVELLMGCLIPVLLIAAPATRRSPVGLVTASASAACGLVLNRLNVGIFGYFRSSEAFYVPTLPEWALSIGIVAAAGFVFLFVSERFAIFDDLLEPARIGRGQPPCEGAHLRPMWQNLRLHRLNHLTLLPVFVIPLAIIVFWEDAVEGYPLRRTPTAPPTAVDATRSVLRIDGDADGDFVVFDHARHQRDFGQSDSCELCHHVYLPGDPQTPCHRCHGDMFRKRNIFDHELHAMRVGQRKAGGLSRELWNDTMAQAGLVRSHGTLDSSGFAAIRLQNRACVQCHPQGEVKSAETALACNACHGREMGLSEKEDPLVTMAASYVDALHQRCIVCHEKEAKRQERPELAECRTCHVSATPLAAPKSTLTAAR
jgi:MFS family permease